MTWLHGVQGQNSFINIAVCGTAHVEPLLLIFVHILLASCESTQRIGHDIEAPSILSTYEIHLLIFSPGKLFSPIFSLRFFLLIRFRNGSSFVVVILRPIMLIKAVFLSFPRRNVEINNGKFSAPVCGKFSFPFLSMEHFL